MALAIVGTGLICSYYVFSFNYSFRIKMKDVKMVDLTKAWHLVYAYGPMCKSR